MHGGLCINEWLLARGHLALKAEPAGPGPLRHDDVDWSRTKAWAEGGYYARIFFNVAGREPDGIVPPSEMAALRDHIVAELEMLTDDEGAPIPTEVRIPEEYYRQVRGFPPDLMVYFDDLRLRAIGSVGVRRRLVRENDGGPDGCNHAWNGIFIMRGGGVPARGRVEGAEIYDVTPTVLGVFGVPRPPNILGRDWSV